MQCAMVGHPCYMPSKIFLRFLLFPIQIDSAMNKNIIPSIGNQRLPQIHLIWYLLWVLQLAIICEQEIQRCTQPGA